MCHVPAPGLCANATYKGRLLWPVHIVKIFPNSLLDIQSHQVLGSCKEICEYVNIIQAALGEYAYSRSQPVISCDAVAVINLHRIANAV